MTFDVFDVCAITFHIGASPHAGHYRTALKYQQRWMIYEDGRPPDQVVTLPESVLRNSVLFWLVRPNLITARTLDSEDPRLFRCFQTIARGIEDGAEDNMGLT